MFTPRLSIPEQKSVPDKYQGVFPDRVSIQSWLNKREHSNHNEFLETLIAINRLQCQLDVRMEVMEILDIEIKKELDELLKKTNTITLPISDTHQNLINTLQQLLLESSIAYQIVINDFYQNKDSKSQNVEKLIPKALFMALKYLSRLLVERFEFYLSEPALIWQEINQFYLLAERIGTQDDMIGKQGSIKHAYLQISILKILNPYRLMRLESRKIYHLLSDWVAHCNIKYYSHHVPEKHFVVNLLSDKSPHYFSPESDSKSVNSSEFEGRVIIMDELKYYLDMQLSEISEQKNKHVFSYQSRMYNEMLQRIDNEMDFHVERAEERVLSGKQIKLVAGLRACHYFISDRKAFKPQDEIDAQQKQKIDIAQSEKAFSEKQDKDEPHINLITLLEEEKLLDKKHPMGELQSVNPFLDETEIVGDRWDYIYADSVISAHTQTGSKQLVQTLKEEDWKQKNESSHGMLLVCKNNIEMPIAVGMLVAFRLSAKKRYCLAIVKWLRVNPRAGIATGIHVIAVQSKPIAVKGHNGVGAGGQFQQAFLIPENDTKGKSGKLHLIIPAGVYDQGSILKIWHNDKINYAKITQILLATDSFERVAFKVVRNK